MPTPQKRNVIQQLSQTYRSMMLAFDAQVGHPLPRWRIILALAERGTCSQKFLAEHCRLDPASLTRQLQSMEALGWLSRATDPDDNRLTNVTLTQAGMAVHDDATPRRQAFFDNALEGMTPEEIATLESALTHLEAQFKAMVSRAKVGTSLDAGPSANGDTKRRASRAPQAQASDPPTVPSASPAPAVRKRASRSRT
ncbi:MarR family winged helix-turn-helix transcriptional regulator [Pandoraea anhela]|uniref:MarR family transcriptional regulator n=1 Tax=Pandoraea anhela TaxID=2508295 RepID=A0A5E4WV06_9BURK|nr:MarR family transcriptional regulator [Pandoraea anhela]VVE28113.1 MarR family transcriptional regulator [Pandoraea anhela]